MNNYYSYYSTFHPVCLIYFYHPNLKAYLNLFAQVAHINAYQSVPLAFRSRWQNDFTMRQYHVRFARRIVWADCWIVERLCSCWTLPQGHKVFPPGFAPPYLKRDSITSRIHKLIKYAQQLAHESAVCFVVSFSLRPVWKCVSANFRVFNHCGKEWEVKRTFKLYEYLLANVLLPTQNSPSPPTLGGKRYIHISFRQSDFSCIFATESTNLFDDSEIRYIIFADIQYWL